MGGKSIALSFGGTAMRTLVITSLAGLALMGACRSNDSRPDDALKNDLALAAQVQPYQAQQFVSPGEQMYGPNGQPLAYTGAAPVRAPAPAPVYRAPARRTSTASRSSSRSSGTYYPAPQQRTVKHTGRDAAIGAGAGAVIGAVTSRDKLKGGLIGAAAGGILGAVIGNNVDVQRP
jgi:outer membrane lipoprotein SlyB